MFWQQHAPEMLCVTAVKMKGASSLVLWPLPATFCCHKHKRRKGRSTAKRTLQVPWQLAQLQRPSESFFCSPKCPDRLWGPSSLCAMGTWWTPPHTHTRFKRPVYEVDHAPPRWRYTSAPPICHFATVCGHNLRLLWTKSPPSYTDDGERPPFNDLNLPSPVASLNTRSDFRLYVINCTFESSHVALQQRSDGPQYRGSLLGMDRTAVASLTHGGSTKPGVFRWG